MDLMILMMILIIFCHDSDDDLKNAVKLDFFSKWELLEQLWLTGRRRQPFTGSNIFSLPARF